MADAFGQTKTPASLSASLPQACSTTCIAQLGAPSNTYNFQICAYVCQYFMNLAFCFQDFQTKQDDFVKTASSRLAHKKVMTFFFFKGIKKDRFLFYCFVCAHHNTRMPPWHEYQKACRWLLAAGAGKHLICAIARASTCSTDSPPDRPRTQFVLVVGHRDSTSICYTKWLKKMTPLSSSGNKYKGNHKDALLAVSRQRACNVTQSLERVFYHETLLHTLTITLVGLCQLCKAIQLIIGCQRLLQNMNAAVTDG